MFFYRVSFMMVQQLVSFWKFDENTGENLMEKPPSEMEKMKSSIIRKLFTRPVRHDCYRCLSKIEKKFIEENAGFNALEMMVFEQRCMGMSFTSIADAIDYHPRYCKTIASRIREKIAYVIQ